ncbi:GNAT family N-acetyltransferase [Pseudovibrio sp. SPO723]|uniref:GNAT family N-acetyltransferase n=1 Tax=Nesiotobacter zosterae TaxID=392721 RepID=UPI0029C46A04|nr:GNAT family N-acetyltransferase [Pseudovibrio sp. SPO723]MDX5593637.1 GNAT family N-acetyltransferase [Pseudovibrio sp. SPO723]
MTMIGGPAPRLESERLVLRGFLPKDLEPSSKLWMQEEVYRHISGKPSTRSECWSRLLNFSGMWNLMGFGYWAVEEKTTGAYVGEIGFADFKREMSVPIEGKPEMGWILSPDFFGKGFGTEAVTTALLWADHHLPFSEVVCIIAPENTASQGLARRVGFIEEEPVLFKDEKTLFYRRQLTAKARAR